MKLKQFDIVIVNLNPTLGSEQQGAQRPCVILQTNAANSYGHTIIIAPLSSNAKIIYPFEGIIKLNKNNNLKNTSKVKCEQIRVIDKSRIIKKVGKLSSDQIDRIDQCLNVIFDLDKNFR